MYIIQMADLHIGSTKKIEPNEKSFILKTAELIKEKVPEGEEILLCLCGDIIDSNKISEKPLGEVENRYCEAGKLIENLKKKLEDAYKVQIKCCQGNHDATHGEAFYGFAKKVDSNPPSKEEIKSCYTVELKGVETKILFVNSCKGEQYKIGCIDYDKLEQELERLGQSEKKIIVLHHAIMSMFDDDDSSVRNAARLVNLIDKYNVIGVLHGHIHGREILSIGKNGCKIIGTGALFSRENSNVNSQFNIIELKKNVFIKILNCRYHADGGNEPWDTKELNVSEKESIFIADSFQTVYKELMNRLEIETPVYNMRIEIENTYERFTSDLEMFLNKDNLKIGENEYTYFELAEMWQSEEVPEQLYFNHGSYFKVGEKSGIDFVVEQLKKKPTSNRIVLPTYNMTDVNNSLDDTNYLPSLVSIQFGKSGEKLIVHMHLRALEAKQFLKINICEIHYLLKKLKEKSVQFEQIGIIISAFRVQKKENFNCFLKAKIDVMESTQLTTLVNYRKISHLCQLFEEKRDAKETITKMQGIQTVYKAMQDSNNVIIEDGGEKIYSEELIDLLKSALEVYAKLDEIHKTLSVQSEEEDKYEQEIDNLLGDFIKKLKLIEEVKA